MKCEMCGNEVERKFELFIPVEGTEDEVVKCCGRCKILCEISDNIEALVEKKKNSFSPVMQ